MKEHIFSGERCIFCNANVYDDMIYGPFECVERDPIRFTTETGDERGSGRYDSEHD